MARVLRRGITCIFRRPMPAAHCLVHRADVILPAAPDAGIHDDEELIALDSVFCPIIVIPGRAVRCAPGIYFSAVLRGPMESGSALGPVIGPRFARTRWAHPGMTVSR